MTRALILVTILAGCDSAPAACPAPAEPRRVADHRGGAIELTTRWVGDHAYYLVEHADVPTSLYVGPRCEEAPLVTRGADMLPARVRLDPADDDPTLACDQLGHFFYLDLTGEQLPALAYPELSCRTIPTAHGLLVRTTLGAGLGLYLYSAFPEPASATLVDDYGLLARLRGDVVYFHDDVYTVARMDLATRETTNVARSVDDWLVSEAHFLWRERVEDEPSPVHIRDLATGTQVQIGASTEEQDGNRSFNLLWRFDPTETMVIHTPVAEGVPIEAFTVDGEPVALPAPGSFVQVLAGGSVISIDGDGQLFHTRPGAQAPNALDREPTPGQLDAPEQAYSVPPFANDRVEVLRADDLWAVPLDGSPAWLLATAVGDRFAWIDEDHLLAQSDGALTTIEISSGRRRVHATGVSAFTTPGELAIDGAHYVDADGVWYLPSVSLTGP
jgi:hypothetical protein